jgi:hypothetical protein
LIQMQRPSDAVRVLQSATSLAKTPDEVNSVQNLMEAAQQYEAAREQTEQSRATAQEVQHAVPPKQSSAQAMVGPARQSATEEPHGPRHGVRGTIKDVQCSLPAIMELKVEGDGKTVFLHSNNYFKIRFTAINFTPEPELNPCSDLDGMKANVEFFDASGKSAEGQIFSIELSK